MNRMATEKKAAIGVFLCRCGKKIAPKVDLAELERRVNEDPLASHVEILPFTCTPPGLKAVKTAIEQKGLDRIIVAGCEPRIILKKFERELKASGIKKGQIDIINLRDHVARVHRDAPENLAQKGAKLVNAAMASMNALIPSGEEKVEFQGPVMILGGGIATYSAAWELIRQKIDVMISVLSDDIDDEIRMLHETYPGERHYHSRLIKIMQAVDASPYVKRITVGEPAKVMGRVGAYSVSFKTDNGSPPRVYQVGAIIAALDGLMLNQGSDFGHDGKRVLCHTELEEYIWLHGVLHEKIIFWINDVETDRPWAQLSMKSAWNMARHIRENSGLAEIAILYNNTITPELGAAERALSRKMGIRWIPYDGNALPTIQSGYFTFTEPETQIEQELPWERLVLSPLRSVGPEALNIAEILGLDIAEGKFLERNPQMVRPEQIGQEEKFLAGSARKPCDLQEALRQGRRAASMVAEIVKKAEAGNLFTPRMVCTVDASKCTGCGLCREICDCGGIEPVEGHGGGTPRHVDPMTCTGGGTCAAACPYGALTLQNNTAAQMEARAGRLAQQLAADEFMGFGCNWGGGAAADNAGIKQLIYDTRFHLIPIACIGQIDPRILGRAFLEGANGLLLIGCPPEECHHSYGVDHAWCRITLLKKLLSHCSLERERIALAHVDLNDPQQYIKSVEGFARTMDRLGPIERTEEVREKMQGMYDALCNPRVRWVLGASLRRPWEKSYPGDQRNALAYDETMSEVVAEEFLRVRLVTLMKNSAKTFELGMIADALGEDKTQLSRCLSDLTSEGIISRIYKNRTPLYSML